MSDLSKYPSKAWPEIAPALASTTASEFIAYCRQRGWSLPDVERRLWQMAEEAAAFAGHLSAINDGAEHIKAAEVQRRVRYAAREIINGFRSIAAEDA